MNLETILAGGFIGIIVQQLMSVLNNYLTFKREKSKIIFQNKLKSGESLIGYYYALSNQVNILLLCMKELADFLDNMEADLDFDYVEKALTTSYALMCEIEANIMNNGSSALLYYTVKTDWDSSDLQHLFWINNRIIPKVAEFNYHYDLDENSEEFAAIKTEITNDVETIRELITKYSLAIKSTMQQLKAQSV